MAVDSAEKGKQELISGIEVDANREAERILSQAEKEVSENRAGVEKQVQSILMEAEEKAKLHAETAARKILSGVEVEVRRKLLQGQHRIFAEVIEKVKERMRELAKSEQYRTVLKSWIIEAMIGLGSEHAEVSASRIDLPFIDEKLLSEATDEMRRLSGKKRTLHLAAKDPGGRPGDAEGQRAEGRVDGQATREGEGHTPWLLRGQGIILTDRGRRIAFNNQLDTRLLRKERQIQAIIYDTLFRETG